jgi:hypothetical protein
MKVCLVQHMRQHEVGRGRGRKLRGSWRPGVARAGSRGATAKSGKSEVKIATSHLAMEHGAEVTNSKRVHLLVHQLELPHQ